MTQSGGAKTRIFRSDRFYNPEAMEARIHILKIKSRGRQNAVLLNREAYTMVGSDRIVLDVPNMRIRIPNFDDNKTYKLYAQSNQHNGKDRPTRQWSFTFASDIYVDLSGDYELEKYGDWIYLIKI